ncbi:hypothetical protein D3C74_373190 [compost metagenome]
MLNFSKGVYVYKLSERQKAMMWAAGTLQKIIHEIPEEFRNVIEPIICQFDDEYKTHCENVEMYTRKYRHMVDTESGIAKRIKAEVPEEYIPFVFLNYRDNLKKLKTSLKQYVVNNHS